MAQVPRRGYLQSASTAHKRRMRHHRPRRTDLQLRCNEIAPTLLLTDTKLTKPSPRRCPVSGPANKSETAPAKVSAALDNLGTEDRVFPPSAEFVGNANVSAEVYERAAADPEAFWAEQANRLSWVSPFSRVLDWSEAPHARWFADGTLNVAYNCVDRHVDDGHGDTVAIHWEGEPGDSCTITYAQLQDEVCKTANALLSLGVQAGDRVVIYLPMIPEALYAMLACARLGAAHGVVFAGFSAHALASRIDDADARVVITADGQYRRGSAVPLKAAVDEAVCGTDSPVEHVLVVRRTGIDITWTDRDLWWDELVDTQSDRHTPEAFPAEQPLFVLYTSGTTGKPKGIVHTSGGYLTQAAYTHHAVFDHKPGTDVHWCTADIGWITGHSYIVYGPLANRVTQVLYEGTPNTRTRVGTGKSSTNTRCRFTTPRPP